MSINISGPVCSTGYGLVVANLVDALDRIGAGPAVWPIGGLEVQPWHREAFHRASQRARLFSPDAPSLRIWHQFDLAQHVGRGRRCAMPIFELDAFTDIEQHHLGAQDLILAPSRWAAEVLRANGIPEGRIAVVPLGVDTEVFRPVPTSKEGPTVFLNVGKWEIRKGHDVLRDAFCAAFTAKDDVKLIMACHNPCTNDAYNRGWRQWYESSPLGSKIVALDARLPSQVEVWQLMASADVGVFPSRAEGWNMELAEMLAMGKPCIATNCTAHTEYVGEAGCRLIEMGPNELACDNMWFMEQGGWPSFEEDQFDQLVQHLRTAHREKQQGTLAPTQWPARLTWTNTAQRIMEVCG